jgi:Predicted phosphohydrolases
MNRRKFLSALASISAMMPFKGVAGTLFSGTKKGFNILLLGDIHFDKPEHHDVEYVKTHSRAGVGEFSRYCKFTRDNFPALMQVVKEQANTFKAEFILQLGDFVQGLCGSKELATRQVNDFISAVKEKNFDRPFIVVKGNHDINGEGAPEMYIDTILPWQAKELKRPVESANLSFVQQNTRFVLFDCYSDDSLEWLQQVLKGHKEQNLVFCCHVPIVPFDERSNLIQYYGDAQKRNTLLNLLGKHKAIVVCGHLHKTCILTRQTAQGNFVQVSICSIIRALDAPVKDVLKGLDAYNGDLVNLLPKFSVNSMPHRRALLMQEKPFIRYYEYANFSGYSTMQIKSNGEITMSIFQNTSKKPWQTVNLSALLKV